MADGLRGESAYKGGCGARRVPRSQNRRSRAYRVLEAAGEGRCLAAGTRVRNEGRGNRKRCSAPETLGRLRDGASMGYFSPRRAARLPLIACYHKCVDGRIRPGLSDVIPDKETVSLGLFERQDCPATTDCLFCVSGHRLFMHVVLFASIRLYTVRVFLLDLFVWPAMGAPRSAATVPDMSPTGRPSRQSRAIVEDLPGLEWD